MSIGRELELNIDLTLMEEVARRAGHTVVRNAPVRSPYRTLKDKADLVIKSPLSYDIGFTQTKEGVTTLLADFERGYANKVLEAIMPAYYEQALQKQGVHFYKKTNTNTEILLYVRR